MHLISNVFRKFFEINYSSLWSLILTQFFFHYPKHLQWLCSWFFKLVGFAFMIKKDFDFLVKMALLTP